MIMLLSGGRMVDLTADHHSNTEAPGTTTMTTTAVTLNEPEDSRRHPLLIQHKTSAATVHPHGAGRCCGPRRVASWLGWMLPRGLTANVSRAAPLTVVITGALGECPLHVASGSFHAGCLDTATGRTSGLLLNITG